MSVNPSVAKKTGLPPADSGFFQLMVARKVALATDIQLFELRHPEGCDLPAFTAGAHITVQTPNGSRRNYSLCSDPSDASMYQIAVKRDATGRGGSISMADELHEGALLSLSAPRNNFELHPRANNFIFVAGGIGITPIFSMMRQLKGQGNQQFKLIYCTRDAANTAFLTELNSTEFSAHVQLHHDHGDINNALDFWPVFETPSNAHVYCCGPRGLMDAVADMTGHWPSGAVHFESFGVDASAFQVNTAFSVYLQKSGVRVPVSADQSILEALLVAGQHVISSCESGTCGSCRTGLLSGQAEHRDMVLTDEEKGSSIMVCVSRATSAELVLDL